jgi:hypothetical protein
VVNKHFRSPRDDAFVLLINLNICFKLTLEKGNAFAEGGVQMKKILVGILILGLLLLPLELYAQSDQKPVIPPVSQSLVPEGDFALKLVPALKLGTPESEAQAEDVLSSAGIAPKNGWIADYPVTPIIVVELQNAVAVAADAQKLPMGKDEALKAFQDVTTEFGLAVSPGGPGQYAENPPQPDGTSINNYYYEEGPPVVTYYTPPWDYYYLYDWVSYPFWCSGFFFPGFFVLADFSIFVGGHHHHHHLITNHFFDPRTHAVRAVDPTTRTLGRTMTASPTRNWGYRSAGSRAAATSIFNRSFGGTATLRGPERTIPGGIAGRTMNREGNIGIQNEANLRQGQSRIINTPHITHGGSFTPPSGVSRSFGSSGNFGRSFSSGNRSFSASHSSFEGFHGSGFSGGSHSFSSFTGGHGSRGFSGGHSFGGFSGGGHIGGGGHGGGHR